MALRDPSRTTSLRTSRPSSAPLRVSEPAAQARAREPAGLTPPDPRERLPFELRAKVNQVLGRHLRGIDVQRMLVGGPLDGRRYGGSSPALERAIDGTVHRYVRIAVAVQRRRRGPLTVFVYDGVGAQLAMSLT